MKLGNIIKMIVAISLLSSLYYFFLLHKTSTKSSSENKPGIDVSEVLSSSDKTSNFRKAVKQRRFRFPDDHGPHKEYQTEWWYFTGNLYDDSNGEYGFQLTFFRRGLQVFSDEVSESDWRFNDVYFAHFALTDVKKKKYNSYEKWSRGMDELAGATGQPVNIWIDDWSLRLENGKFIIRACKDDAEIDLVMSSQKDIVLHGENGLSAKSSEVGNASYYYSATRLETSGTIRTNNNIADVKGLSWFDHEWSTSVLDPDQEGWDWFSLQLNDYTEIMLYQLRLKNGEVDPVSSGTFVHYDGKLHKLVSSDFNIEVLSTWKSKDTGTVYPAKWRVSIKPIDKSLLIEPLLDKQEFNHLFKYWEGAVSVRSLGSEIGRGYVELTGY